MYSQETAVRPPLRDDHGDQPSVASALEHVVHASQQVITKRIDLALLEGRQTLVGAVTGAVIGIVGIIVACAAWFAFAAAVVGLFAGGTSAAAQLAFFGCINAVAALVLAPLAAKQLRRTATRPEHAASQLLNGSAPGRGELALERKT